jgi:hypothetical protein
MRFKCSRVLSIAVTSLIAISSLAASAIAPAGAASGGPVLHCTGAPNELEAVINSAAVGSTIKLDGTCVGNFYIDKNLTLAGPAILDGGNNGLTLNVVAGSVVVLNDLTIQHGTGIVGFGGGVWNSGQLILNRTTITDNHTGFAGGVFNMGELTLNRSTVSANTASLSAAGGIFNCGDSFFRDFGLCLGAPAQLTLNNSTVADNSAQFNGGGIYNDPQASVTLNGATVSGNAAGGGGGGIANNGTLALNSSTVSGNSAFSGGGINNGLDNNGSGIQTATATLNNSTVQGNTGVLLGGAITTSGPLTVNRGTVSDNSAGPGVPGFFVGGFGGAIFVFSQATTVANSTFSNNTATSGLDNPPGILLQAPEFGGSGTFTTTHSTYN